VTWLVGVTEDLWDESGQPRFVMAWPAAGGDVTFVRLPADAGSLSRAELDRYDSLLIFGSGPLDNGTLGDCGRLRHLARLGVGLDLLDPRGCAAAGIAVTTTPRSVIEPIAAGTVALLLALAYEIPWKAELARRGRWSDRLNLVSVGLAGATVGIIGPGRLGAAIIRLTREFGPRHLVYGPRTTRPQADALGAELVGFEEILRRSDYLCLTCPLSEETRGLIGDDALALVKPDAALVNVSRGAVVDQRALVKALDEGRLRAAALDVLDPEPPDPDDPVLCHDRILITPHSAGYTRRMFDEVVAEGIDSIVALAGRRRPDAVVDSSAFDHARWAGYFTQARS